MIKTISPIVDILAQYTVLPNGKIRVLQVVRESTGHKFTDPRMIELCETNIKNILAGRTIVPQCGG